MLKSAVCTLRPKSTALISVVDLFLRLFWSPLSTAHVVGKGPTTCPTALNQSFYSENLCRKRASEPDVWWMHCRGSMENYHEAQVSADILVIAFGARHFMMLSWKFASDNYFFHCTFLNFIIPAAACFPSKNDTFEGKAIIIILEETCWRREESSPLKINWLWMNKHDNLARRRTLRNQLHCNKTQFEVLSFL